MANFPDKLKKPEAIEEKPNPGVQPPPEESSNVPIEQPIPGVLSVKKPTTGIYRDTQGKKLFNEQGIAVKSVEGYLYPKDPSEIELVEYYVSIGLVTKEGN